MDMPDVFGTNIFVCVKGWGLTFLTRGFGFYGKPVIGFGFAFSAGLFRT